MLKLSQILPPDAAITTSSGKPTENAPDEPCPRSIIGALPPSAPLHLAIAHQLGSKTYESFGKHREEGIDDLSASKTTDDQTRTEIPSPNSVLIIASERSKWHESLILEKSSWLQEYGGNPRIADALESTDIKYCSTAKDALILLTLLHLPSTNSPNTIESDTSTLTGEPPSLIITWDLLDLFLKSEQNDENDPDSAGNDSEMQDGTGEPAANAVVGKEPSSAQFLDGTSPQDYLSLISTLRQAVDQLGDITTGSKPDFVILEPQMTSTMEVPVTYATQLQPPIRSFDRKKQQTFNLGKGLYWLLAPGYRDLDNNRLAISNISLDRQTGDMIGSPPRQLESQRFRIENLSGDIISVFERSLDHLNDDRPWLDRESSTYRWAQL